MIERAVRDPHRTRYRLAMLPARMAVVVALNLAMAHWMASIWESFADNRGWAFSSYMFDGSLLTDCLMQSARNASCVSSDHLAHGAVNPAYTYDSTTPYSSTWQTSSSYGPWGTALDLPGWSVVASDPNFYSTRSPASRETSPGDQATSVSLPENVARRDIVQGGRYYRRGGEG
jgi:hypothetical protein